MNPTYQFVIANHTTPPVPQTFREAKPIYGSDLAVEIARASGEQYYRRTLTGKLTFVADDYDFIMAQPFDTPIYVYLHIRYSDTENFVPYWAGKFWRTDCVINVDDRSIEVTPSVEDDYVKILDGLDKEFNLIDLLPAMDNIFIDKRAMIQAYVPGQTSIGCFLSGMWWEQDCDAVTSANELRNIYKFALNVTYREAQITSSNASIPHAMGIRYTGAAPDFALLSGYEYVVQQDGWTLTVRESTQTEIHISGYGNYCAFLTDGTTTYQNTNIDSMALPKEITLNDGTVVYIHDTAVWMRIVCDVDSVEGTATSDLPANDLVGDNRNYKKVGPYNAPSLIYFTTRTSTQPTKWGLMQPGVYYNIPNVVPRRDFFPIARNEWSSFSIWFAFSLMDWQAEPTWRKEYILKDAYYLWSVIAVLLNAIGANVQHDNSTDSSQFLYGENPIDGRTQTLFVVPKSNIIVAGYDQPAQKAPITLRRVLDMLRDVYRCYWYIDMGYLRIEHISYFMNGGSYEDTPEVGIDLTAWKVERNGKKWSFGTSKYSFNKSAMPARYEFGWMDDVTQMFEGFPINILSGYVNEESKETVQVQNFTSDIDYILLNPDAVSMDGFAVLAAVAQTGREANWKVAYYDYQYAGGQYYLQNGYLAFYYLRRFYRYDLPAWDYEYDGEELTALGIKRQRTQSLRFPALTDPDPVKLVKTEIGNGQIEKISVNLLSRNANATLEYDTE